MCVTSWRDFQSNGKGFITKFDLQLLLLLKAHYLLPFKLQYTASVSKIYHLQGKTLEIKINFLFNICISVYINIKTLYKHYTVCTYVEESKHVVS